MSEAADELGRIGPRDVLSDERKLNSLNAELRRQKSLVKTANSEIERLTTRLDAYEMLAGVGESWPILPRLPNSSAEAAACFVTSDWHIEEQVDPATVGGVNEYNPDIAQERVHWSFRNALTLVNKERALATIKDMVVFALGDMMSGFIHEELAQTNYLSPLQAMDLSREILTQGLEFLGNHGDFETIHVVCKIGNHGRVNPQKTIKNAWQHSYEWLAYVDVARRFAGDDRFKFTIEKSWITMTDIYDYPVRSWHGDAMRFGGGVGGLTIPLYKKIARWNTKARAVYDVLGHFHQLQFPKFACVNGSVIGYSPYAEYIAGEYEPPQQALFLVVKNHGPCCWNRVFCEEA